MLTLRHRPSTVTPPGRPVGSGGSDHDAVPTTSRSRFGRRLVDRCAITTMARGGRSPSCSIWTPSSRSGGGGQTRRGAGRGRAAYRDPIDAGSPHLPHRNPVRRDPRDDSSSRRQLSRTISPTTAPIGLALVAVQDPPDKPRDLADRRARGYTRSQRRREASTPPARRAGGPERRAIPTYTMWSEWPGSRSTRCRGRLAVRCVTVSCTPPEDSAASVNGPFRRVSEIIDSLHPDRAFPTAELDTYNRPPIRRDGDRPPSLRHGPYEGRMSANTSPTNGATVVSAMRSRATGTHLVSEGSPLWAALLASRWRGLRLRGR